MLELLKLQKQKMRSSLHSMKSTNLGTYSQIGGIGTMNLIKNNNNFVSKDSKFNQAEQIGNFFEKLFGIAPITEKDLADARKIGYSYKKYENGDVYYGQLENDRPHGQGIYIYWQMAQDKKPYFYKGGFQNGQFSGFGKFCKILNERQAMYCYQGNWKANKRQGDGKQNYNLQNTMYYKGNFNNDQRQGRGILYMLDGTYEGNWMNGCMTGEGSMTIERGPFKKIISGQWIDDEIIQGVIQYFSKPSNNLLGQYRGGIRNLLRHGEGQYQTGGSVIQGQFIDDELVGVSILKNSNGSQQFIIRGDLTQPRLQRLESEIKYVNNDRYIGRIEITPNNIIRRTTGKYYFSNGEAVEGDFDDNDKGELRKR